MIVLFLILSVIVGLCIGYLIAVARTDRLIAAMTEDEVSALGARVRARRSLKGG